MKNKFFKIVAVLCVALTVFTTSPMLPSSVATSTIVAQAATIKLSKTKMTIVKGQTKELAIKGTKKKVKWSTNKKSVATVSSKGVVTAKGKGKAIITAKVNGKKYTCKVTVENPSISKTKATIKKNKSFTLKIKGTTQTIKWTSSNTKVATVSDGVVTGIKPGTATIKAKLKSGKTYKCTVTVKDLSNLEKLQNDFSIKMIIPRNGTNNSYVQIHYENHTKKPVYLDSIVYANGRGCYNSNMDDYKLDNDYYVVATYYRDLTVYSRYETNDMYLDSYSTAHGGLTIDGERFVFITDMYGNVQFGKTNADIGVY